MAAVDMLPKMLMHQCDHTVPHNEPAGRCDLYGQQLDACTKSGGDNVPQGASDVLQALPHLPSIKESMPFLCALGHASSGKDEALVKEGEECDSAECLVHMSQHPMPPFGCRDFHASAYGEHPPALTSAPGSTTPSPNVFPQRPPSSDPVKAELNSPRSKEPTTTPEGEAPDRVGGQDWGERRKRAKREQTFNVSCPRSQRIAHLKLVVARLMSALPLTERQPFVAGVKRYMSGELAPEDFGEQIKTLVDTHNIVVELPAPLDHGVPHAKSERVGDIVLSKPIKRGAGGESESGKGRASKSARTNGKPPTGPSPSASRAPAVSISKSSLSTKKRKPSASALPVAHEDKPAPKSGKGAGGGSGGKVLTGALTPVTVFGGVKCENGVDKDAENSAWDALLSVCAQMPRQKAK